MAAAGGFHTLVGVAKALCGADGIRAMFDDDEVGVAEGIANGAGLFESPLVARESGVERRLLGGLPALVQSLSCGSGIVHPYSDVFSFPVQIVGCRAHAVVRLTEIGVRRSEERRVG